MKRSKEYLILAVAIAAALFVSNVSAQEKGERKGPRGDRAEMVGERMVKELGLSADQAAQFKAINESYRPKMEALREDQTLSREQRREKVQALNKEREAKVDALLTPEQLAKAKELRAKAQERMKERRGPKGGEGYDGPPREKN